jgi:hypothetical protein
VELKGGTMKRKADILEPLMASFLTLDWELSPQAIGKFEKELQGLKEKLSSDAHSKKLINLALPVCDYLRLRKGSASPASIQFLHEATRTLYRFHHGKNLTANEHRETIKKLCNKFKNLMDDVKRVNLLVTQATRQKPKPDEIAPGIKAAAKTSAKNGRSTSKSAGQRGRKTSPRADVLSTVKKHKQGIDIPTLKAITGLPDSNVRTIVYRAAKEGKIKRVSRGVYASA